MICVAKLKVASLCRGVCLLSRCCYALGKIELHSSVQLADNQSGFLTINRSSSAAGMSVGVGWACGYNDLNNDMLLRDSAMSASVILLCCPLMCEANKKNSHFAIINAKHLTRCIASRSLLVPWLMMATTASLSHHTCTDCPLHCGPHKPAAMVMGSSSLTVMCRDTALAGHFNENH